MLKPSKFGIVREAKGRRHTDRWLGYTGRWNACVQDCRTWPTRSGAQSFLRSMRRLRTCKTLKPPKVEAIYTIEWKLADCNIRYDRPMWFGKLVNSR